jgi:Tfp pilus assembly protein PilX
MLSGLKSQKGAALLVALGIMVMLTLIGIAAVTTSSLDITISGSDKRSTQALYLAEAGLERAIYEYLWPNFSDENTSPSTDLFGWLETRCTKRSASPDRGTIPSGSARSAILAWSLLTPSVGT